MAIEMLIEDWRDTRLSWEEVLFILDPLAAHIHRVSPTGLVEEAELRQVVTEYLAVYRNKPLDTPSLAEDVRTFIGKLHKHVGLIAARGDQLFGFLHLTFQEYLAGRYLVRNPRAAAANIVQHLSEPRWREPILLGLGYAVWDRQWTANQRRDLLNALLAADDPLGVFLPRAALFVVDALTEMQGVPRDSFRLLVRRLLIAYADRETLGRFAALRKRIEEAFQKVRRFGSRDWMDEVLAEAIRCPDPPGLAPAAAALVREQEWFTPVIVEALSEGLDNDGPAWGWPIERSLRDLVSPELPEFEPPVPTPLDAAVRAVLEELRKLESGQLLLDTEAQLKELGACPRIRPGGPFVAPWRPTSRFLTTFETP
jgi:hypothetical protein